MSAIDVSGSILLIVAFAVFGGLFLYIIFRKGTVNANVEMLDTQVSGTSLLTGKGNKQ
jgi:hypothetical protein